MRCWGCSEERLPQRARGDPGRLQSGGGRAASTPSSTSTSPPRQDPDGEFKSTHTCAMAGALKWGRNGQIEISQAAAAAWAGASQIPKPCLALPLHRAPGIPSTISQRSGPGSPCHQDPRPS